MPAFAADFFGAKDVGSIYGAMLTAWGAATLFGPTLVARLRKSTGHYQGVTANHCDRHAAECDIAVVPATSKPWQRKKHHGRRV